MEQQPLYRPPQSATHTTAPKPKSKKQLTWALICLLGPTALFIITLFLYAILNFVASTTAGSGADAFDDTPLHTISNVILFLVGTVVVLTWLPGIIVGIVLLATRK